MSKNDINEQIEFNYYNCSINYCSNVNENELEDWSIDDALTRLLPSIRLYTNDFKYDHKIMNEYCLIFDDLLRHNIIFDRAINQMILHSVMTNLNPFDNCTLVVNLIFKDKNDEHYVYMFKLWLYIKLDDDDDFTIDTAVMTYMGGEEYEKEFDDD